MRSGELGEVFFITSSRMNLGLYQRDGVISDLAPHDLSILLYWLERPLVRISAAAQSIFQLGWEASCQVSNEQRGLELSPRRLWAGAPAITR